MTREETANTVDNLLLSREEVEQYQSRYEPVKQHLVDSVQSVASSRNVHGNATLAYGVVGLLMASLFLAPIGVKFLRARRRNEKIAESYSRVANLLRSCELVLAPLVMFNRGLRRSSNVPGTALALVSFDERANGSDYLTDLAVKISSKGDSSWSEDDRQFAHRLCAEVDYKHFRRVRLPDTMTLGFPVCACHSALHPQLFLNHKLDPGFPVVLYAATPGDFGIIQQVPYWLIRDDPSVPDQVELRAFHEMVAYLAELAPSIEALKLAA